MSNLSEPMEFDPDFGKDCKICKFRKGDRILPNGHSANMGLHSNCQKFPDTHKPCDYMYPNKCPFFEKE